MDSERKVRDGGTIVYLGIRTHSTPGCVACRFVALILLVVLSPLVIEAEVLSWPEEWRWGITEFDDAGVSLGQSYLIREIPLEIANSLPPISGHRMSMEEVEAYIQREHGEAMNALSEKESELRRKMDRKIFEVDFSMEQLDELKEELQQLREEKEELSRKVLFNGQAPDSIPLVLSEENQKNELLPPLLTPYEEYSSNLEYLATGTLEEIEGVLYLTFRIYSFLENRDIFSFTGGLLPEDREKVISQLAESIIATLTGRSWCSLTVVSNVGANIYLNGEVVGNTMVELPVLEPGLYKVESVLTGHISRVEEIVVLPYEKKKIHIELDKAAWLELSIETDPTNAELFLGSRLIGRSPWVGDIPPNYSSLAIRKNGYIELIQPIVPADSNSLEYSLTLKPDTVDSEALLEAAREKFYFSLALFAFSIPVSLGLIATSSSYGNSASLELELSGTTAEYDRLNRISTGTLYGFYGGLALNIGLFVMLVIDAVSYVQEAESQASE